ncbi:MAG: hypothetical protein J6Y02_04560 [Pseudobutyrivibrio sp.]|nr:hypothetical protein [Pseudobutyrivibrio sp.]
MLVKISKVSGKPTGVFVNEGSTVRDALREAGINFENGEQINIDGSVGQLDTPVYEGARIRISESTKGGC